MPSSSVGGSIGGGGFSSGGGGGSSYGGGSGGSGKNHYVPRFSTSKPFRGARKYYFFDKRGVKRTFFYSHKPKIKSITSFVWVITTLLVFGIGMLSLTLYMSIPHKQNSKYCNFYPEYVEDKSGLFTQSEKEYLTNSLEKFYQETGIQPFVYAVEYSDVPVIYKPITMETLNKYALSIYKQYFDDEGHCLILYTINNTAEIEEDKPREQMWIEMTGYDAQKTFKFEDLTKFKNLLDGKLEKDVDSPLKSIGDSFTQCIDVIVNLETMDIVIIVIASIFIPILLAVPLIFIIKSMRQRIMINAYCDYRDKNGWRDFTEQIKETEKSTLSKSKKKSKH